MSLLEILLQNTTLTELDLSSNACVRFTAAPVAHIMEVMHSTERVFYRFFFPIYPLHVYLFIERTSAATPAFISQPLPLHTL